MTELTWNCVREYAWSGCWFFPLWIEDIPLMCKISFTLVRPCKTSLCCNSSTYVCSVFFEIAWVIYRWLRELDIIRRVLPCCHFFLSLHILTVTFHFVNHTFKFCFIFLLLLLCLCWDTFFYLMELLKELSFAVEFLFLLIFFLFHCFLNSIMEVTVTLGKFYMLSCDVELILFLWLLEFAAEMRLMY